MEQFYYFDTNFNNDQMDTVTGLVRSRNFSNGCHMSQICLLLTHTHTHTHTHTLSLSLPSQIALSEMQQPKFSFHIQPLTKLDEKLTTFDLSFPIQTIQTLLSFIAQIKKG